jgi:hypothetical protein
MNGMLRRVGRRGLDRRGFAMMTFHEEYVVDDKGTRKSVVIPMNEWERVLEAIEELEDIRAYDEAKSLPSDPVPLEKALEEIRDGKPL